MTYAIPTVVLGCGNIGDASDPIAKFSTPQAAQEFVSLFRKYGHKELDTARAYSPHAFGTSEPLLGQTDFANWALLDTKVKSFVPGAHKAETIAQSVVDSLEALRVPNVHIEYLHAPDRDTPFEETCCAINEEYKAGKFERFGLSNHSPAEVVQIVQICETKGWIKPSVYQGMYNALARLPEDELLPVLRKHNISFYAYSPGAGGLFSGKITKQSINAQGTRWDKNTMIGRLYADMYHKDALFDAANRVHAEAERAGITGHAVALRWMLHHSQLIADRGDALIIGASSLGQLEENLKICAAGPLPEKVVQIVEECWKPAKPFAPPATY